MDSQQNGSALVELAQGPIGHDDCLQNRETVYRRRQTQAPGLKSSAVASPPPIADIVDTRPEGAGTAPLLQSMTTTTAAGPLPLIQVLLPHLRGCWDGETGWICCTRHIQGATLQAATRIVLT